jgi:Kef-type K+ transport system membrane component KefB
VLVQLQTADCLESSLWEMSVLDTFLLQLAVILFVTKIAGALSKRLSQPAVLGEIAAGIIMGPSVFGFIQDTELLRQFAQIGVIMLMFIAGIETDARELQESGKSSAAIALGGVFLPFVGGTAAALTFGFGVAESVFVGCILTATSVSISAQTLMEMGQLKSREGITILGAAVIDDVLGILVLTLVAGYAAGSGNIGLEIVKISVFFGMCFFLGGRMVRRTTSYAASAGIQESLLTFTLIVVFVLAFVSEYAGVAAITGAYIAGLLFGATPYRNKISEKAQIIAYSFFVPMFFVSIGVRADIKSFASSALFAFVLTLVAVLTKVLGCGFGAKLTGFDSKGALRVGIGMISRGEVALIVATIGNKMGFLNGTMFSVIVVMTLVTTLVTPPLLRLAFRNEVERMGNKKESLVTRVG